MTPDVALAHLRRDFNSIRTALDQSAIVAITDRHGTIVHVNDKFCETSKYSRQELLGKNHRLLNSNHHPKELFTQMWKTISSGHTWQGEIKNRAKDGTYYWVATTIVPFLDDTGRPFQYVSIRFEITQLKLYEEQLKARTEGLEQLNTKLAQDLKRTWALDDIVGKSHGMRTVFELITRVSGAMANVLITGESGTGKEMVARAIHNAGPRKAKPFVAINCTAIPDTLLESELFGHAKGSFTGAIQRKRGLFEEADGGTLFLDEIGDMPVALQSKLLRVIQEKKVRAVGDNTPHDVDVRIIAATHKDLKAAIREGLFREDLYYRLSVIPIQVPPLRERSEDIPLLAEHFLRKYSATNGGRVQGFTPEAMARLMSLRWDGNVRELENMIERLVVLAPGSLIEAADIPTNESKSSDQLYLATTQDFPTLEQIEKRYIRMVLDKTGGRKDRAAQILGINRRTLYRKEREYGFVTGPHPDDADLDLTQPPEGPTGDITGGEALEDYPETPIQ